MYLIEGIFWVIIICKILREIVWKNESLFLKEDCDY